MEASLKEKAVFAGLGVFLAYALGAGWWMMSGKASIEDAKKADGARQIDLRARKAAHF